MTTDINEELTRYLLGEMSEEEQTEFEMRYFCDPQLFGELCAWRNNLIDRYVSGHLSSSMRERFEAGIDKSWAINERIRFAETLQGEIDVRGAGLPSPPRGRSIRTRESWLRFARIYRRPIVVATICLIIVGIGWLIVRSLQRGTHDGSETGYENSTSPTFDKAAASPNQSRVIPTGSPALSDKPTGDNSNSLLTVPLTSDSTGTANDVRADVLIPPSTVIVKLVLILDQPQDADYSAVVKTPKDAEIFRTDSLKPHTNEVGTAIDLFVPANRLPEGDYIVRLSGVTANNESIDAGNYHLRVRKS